MKLLTSASQKRNFRIRECSNIFDLKLGHHMSCPARECSVYDSNENKMGNR